VADDERDLAGGEQPEPTEEPAAGPFAAEGTGIAHADLPDEIEHPGPGSALPPRVERWRRRSATGAMLTGFAMGLREVLETEQREPAIVMETSGVPPRDLAVEADLENPSPRQSVVKVRRWLLTDPDGTGHAAGTPSDEGEVAGAGPAARPTEIRKRRRRTRSSRIFGQRGK